MSDTNNKPLTAQEFFDQNKIEVDEDWIGTNMIPVSSFNHCMLAYAAQQTAALREELEEELKKNTFSYTSVFTDRAALREELEAVKKERDWLKEQFNLLRDKYSRIVPERDGLKSANVGLQEVLHNTLSDRNEAVKLLKSASDIVKKCNYPGACYSVPAILKALFDNNVNSFISRLSSGETNPNTDANLASQLKKEMPETYPGKAYQPLFDHMSKEHNVTLLQSEMYDIIEIVRKMVSPWISVEDRPLFTKDHSGWKCTEAGCKEFLAAVPYSDESKPGRDLWWIRHCVVEDETGLCVVGDDDNQPAGWSLEDVAFYLPLPDPPESLTDKK